MIELRFEDLEIDESPPTIAYVILTMLATVMDFDIESNSYEFGEEWVVIRDNEGDIVFRVGVSPMMARLLLSILDRVGAELNGTIDEGW